MRHLTLGLVLILLAAPAMADPGVHTDREGARVLPLPKEEGVFHFLVFGDRTGGPVEGLEVLKTAVRDANLLGPDLVMTVGDLVNGYNDTEPWLEEMREYRDIMKGLEVPWFPVAGNHDVYWFGEGARFDKHEKEYEEHFGPLWYWFGHKNAAFIVLFTDEGNLETGAKGYNRPDLTKFSDRQLTWLQKTLGETKDFDHVFVFMHHPRWIPNGYPGTNWERVHPMLVEAGNVAAVIGGHIHRQRYEGQRDGIQYMTLACTGGGMPFDVPGTGFLHHMNLVTVRKEKVTMATIPVGTVLDPRAMTPEALADIDKARSLPIVTAKDAVHIAHDFGGGGQAAYRIKNPAARPIELQVSSIHGAREWLVYPSHAHVTIDPGEEKIVSFLFRREGDDGKCFVVPRLSFQVDYVAADRRVSLPEIVVDVPTRIEFTKEDLAATRERVAIFDGRRSCLSVASSAVRLPAKDPFTVEAWVRPTNLRGMRIVVGKTENSEFLLGVQDGEPKFYVHVGEGYVILDTGETIPKGVWTHLAAVRDETEVRLYVNGKLANRAAVSGPRTLNTMPLYVGAEPDAAGRPQMFFAGRMDLVRISGCARYAGESFEPAVKLAADEKTRLLLKMDTNRGPYLPDHSASGAHAVRKGPVVLEPATVVPGK